MSKTYVTLFQPNGKTIIFDEPKSAYKNDNGLFYVQPSEADVPTWGKLVTTNLPFILIEK